MVASFRFGGWTPREDASPSPRGRSKVSSTCGFRRFVTPGRSQCVDVSIGDYSPSRNNGTRSVVGVTLARAGELPVRSCAFPLDLGRRSGLTDEPGTNGLHNLYPTGAQ